MQQPEFPVLLGRPSAAGEVHESGKVLSDFISFQADTLAVRTCPEPKSVVSLWHRIQQVLLCNWRPVAAASALVTLTGAVRQRNVMVRAGLLGVTGIIAAAGAAAHRRQRLINKVRVLAPKALDEMAMKSRLTECDFSGVISSIRMEGKMSASDLESLSSPPRDVEDVDGTALNEYQATLCYLRQFLAKPHPAVGRTGPVCPFMPKALQLETVKLSVVRTHATPRCDVRRRVGELLLDFIPRFQAMEPTVGRQRQYKAMIFIFPDVALQDAIDVIDGAQDDTKAEFVSRGLMVGQFHALNNNSGLRNPDFYPLRTPVPCLAIRHMVPGDLAFMTLDSYTVNLQRKLLHSFLDVFGDENLEEVRSAANKLEELEKC